MTFAPVPSEIAALVARGALFVVNHSGGKDSQAMLIYLRQFVPAPHLLVIHAELPEVDWPGIKEHITDTIGDLPFATCRAKITLLERVLARGMWPSPARRWCTSDLKRGPLEKLIRATGEKLIVSCSGMRAEESSARSRLVTFKFSERNSKAGREWYDWLPIHELTKEQVFGAIADAGQKPHWAYAAGMSRLSCSFCIMSSLSDLKTAAKLRPALYHRYVQTERLTGHAMMMPTKKSGARTLEEITGILANADAVDLPPPAPERRPARVIPIEFHQK